MNDLPPVKLEADLERKLEELPLLPAVVSAMLDLNPEADNYFDRLVELAERDPPFAIRVLRCANSAFSSPVAPIISLRQAVMRLGSDQCAGLVLALAVIKVFVPHSDAQRFLWIHSLQTALFARMLCQHVPAMRRAADEAYVCGLLHDIGRFVQFEGAPADLARVDDRHWTSSQELVEVERVALGYDHTLLGWHACRKWSLPASIAEVVLHHHDSSLAESSEPLTLTQIVQKADMLSIAMMKKPDLAGAGPEELATCLSTECPGLDAGLPRGNEPSWHFRVSELYGRSFALARQLHLLPSTSDDRQSSITGHIRPKPALR